MKTLFTIAACTLLTVGLQAQTIDELKSMKAEKAAAAAELQSQANALNAEVADLQNQIELASGWRTALNGMVGFNLSNSNGWIANPNPDATSTGLNIGLAASANLSKEKSFWNNRLMINKAWQDVDVDKDEDDNLFDNGTVDILNVSSLGGYKLMPKLALSAMGEFNSSINNFLEPGTIDIGTGITWLPVNNMTVVIHPLNYNYKFSGLENVESSGSVGAKVRVDYSKGFLVSGKNIAWSSTLTGFVPYKDKKQTITAPDGTDYEAGLAEFTWLNSLSFQVWKGIGVGVSFGLRNAQFESMDLQSYTALGLSYGF